ncbi:hypothetical protein ELZ88_24615 (plasmid) [Salmonella enterica subsp. enterica serovar Karamoja]|uniref:Uncharacterized protein n=1 Tax=Salmonella enterica subsp. enterica serovar Karamoja TaxID=2500153 RepID=A0A3T0CIG3_SALET|nr:hypothetical protein [Salmonella enterica]AZT39709.1 hypothetical protein ELZ88_24615 [Salmonella enterica subsp. enterica serovar Karamoja]AZT44388.1 hypothetical protein EL007_24330 [Salmonella enterica subsp. enterica serovar Karamoja]
MGNKEFYRNVINQERILACGFAAFVLIFLVGSSIVFLQSASETHQHKKLDPAAFISENHCRLTSATEYEFEYLCNNQVKFTTSYYEGKDGKQKHSQK